MPTDTSKSRRLELILRQIDALPTLPAVATRLLALTASEDSNARQVTEIISADQTLTAKVLSLCRQADRGVREEVATIDKAVVLLGFSAVRNAVLSIKVFETFEGPAPRGPRHPRKGRRLRAAARAASGPESGQGGAADAADVADAPAPDRFDRVNFWRHSLAVATAAEAIAAAHAAGSSARDLPPAEAFVAGLLHDIGKLALDHVLPKSFSRVIELADLNQGNIADFERRVIGLDHHTAGKRLAEQWQLPHRLQDCMWLHGSVYDSLPRLEHRRLIGLVSLADMIVRRQHLGYSGNFTFSQSAEELAGKLGLDMGRIEGVVRGLHEGVQSRSRVLGLDERPSRELFLQSIQQANQELGRLNAALERRGRTLARQGQVLDAIAAFHAAAVPGRGVPDVLNLIAANAAAALGQGFYALLHQADAGEPNQPWLICQYARDGRLIRSQFIEPPPHAPPLRDLEIDQPMSVGLMGLLPWLADYLLEAPDLREVRLLPLASGWGTAAVMLHNQPLLPPWSQMSALASTWGAAVAAAGQHEGARRLGEELADVNRALADAHDKLLQSETMARLGEMAAGAAHEMNNPLAVISGRSELLAMTLPGGGKEQKAAQTIYEQAHRLSDLITSLRLFAEPPKIDAKPTDVAALLDETIKRARTEHRGQHADMYIDLQIKSRLPTLNIDAQQVGGALMELISNAIQSSPRKGVHVSARVEPIERHVLIQVTDDGSGMDAHTLAHAMDPFFSAKTAGRRMGMGLPRARQYITAHGGYIDLRSTVGEGTTASIFLPLEEGDEKAVADP